MSNSDVTPHTLAISRLSIADGGIETALETRLGQEFSEFAAFVLLDTNEGRAALTEYYRPFIQLAAVEGMPLVLDTPTWRANPDWGALLGYSTAQLSCSNIAAAKLVREAALQFAPALDLTVSGCIGPRFDDDSAGADGSESGGTGDVYSMTVDEAEAYHTPQVRALFEGGVDCVGAVTMTSATEAIGIVRAARNIGGPVTVSFAVGADGHLPGGVTLAAAIREVEAATDSYAVGYLVNCAHPSEAARALSGRELSEAEARVLSSRVIGFRLNAARHDETGPGDNPAAFSQQILELRPLAPAARLFGGCCGTDAPHIRAIVEGIAAASRT